VALESRFDYQTVADRVEDAERRVHVAEDALRAGLTLATGITGSSDVGQPLDFGSENLRWDARLSLDLPLERLPERNAYRTALIRLEASERQRVETEDTIKVQLRAALRSLAAARESFDIQTGAVILAERRVESAALNLEAGRASTRDLLEAQESRVQAENAATRALTDYTLARLAFFRDLGLLRVDEDGVAVEIERMTTTEEERTP
jgi:outer membrane protein TolC